jgi:ankyrin repeat protein
MVKYLLSLFESTSADRKSFANKQNQSGNTSLHWSALNGHMDIVKTLLAHGADASILNTSGHDAVYEAEMNDKQELAEYLLKEALGLEKAIGREGDGKEAEDEEMEEAESSAAAERVADGMAEMDLKGGEIGKEGG